MRKIGPFQFQAAIAELPAEPDRPKDADWPQIALLYGELERIQPGPVVKLNRAAATAMALGPEFGLRIIEEIEAKGSLERYHPLHARTSAGQAASKSLPALTGGRWSSARTPPRHATGSDVCVKLRPDRRSRAHHRVRTLRRCTPSAL
jgi:hypothetical protein